MFEHAGEINADSFAMNCRRQQEAGLSNQTLKRDLWAVKRAYARAASHDSSLSALGALLRLKTSPPGRACGQEVTRQTLVAWLSQLKHEPRAKALIGLTTGICSEELDRYKRSWLTASVEVGVKTYVLSMPAPCTKGKRERRVVVCKKVADLLTKYAPFRVDYRRARNTASTRVGLTKPISMRDLRTTFATVMGEHD